MDRLLPTSATEDNNPVCPVHRGHSEIDDARWARWAAVADLPPPAEPLQNFEVYRETGLKEVFVRFSDSGYL